MPSDVSRDAPPAEALLNQLEFVRLHVRGAASLVGADMDDPGTMDWYATATLPVWLDDEDDETDASWTAGGAGLSVRDLAGGGRELVLLEASGLIVDLWRVGDVSDALDARSADYEHFVRMFGDREETFGQLELHPDLEEMLTPDGNQVVLLDRVRLAPAWRGLGGVGRLLTARLLDWICDRPRVVAVHPFPIDLDEAARNDPVRFSEASERVRRTWRLLAFEPFTDDIWVMDPRMAAHGKAVEGIARRLGV